MKILYISHSNTDDTGASKALINNIKEVIHYHEIYVALPSGGNLATILTNIGCTCFNCHIGIHIYPLHKNPLLWIKQFIRDVYFWNKGLKQLELIIRKNRIDLIHSNVGVLHYGYLLEKKCNIPHIRHLREFQDKDFGMYYFPTFSSIKRELNTPGNYSIAITKQVADHFNLNANKNKIIYDGVFSFTNNESILMKSREKIILFVGRICEAKGTLDLIKAFSQFNKKIQNYKLYIVGTASSIEYLHKCKTLTELEGIANKVYFLGLRNDVYDLMQKATAIVVPSRNEGFGFITSEAMFNGCLVIGRNTAGTKEQFDLGLEQTGKEIGLRFSTDNELIRCLIKVATFNLCDMKERAYKVVISNYTIEKSTEQLLRYYDFVINDYKKYKQI